MTQNHIQTEVGQHRTPPLRTPRLRLKAKAPQSGHVDGAWWPRTDDLLAELPDLLAVLAVRLGPIERVLFNLGEWRTAPAKVAMGGRAVRLDGYRHQPSHTVEVIGHSRRRILLLLVPPSTDPESAHTAMMAAAAVRDSSTVEALLTSRAPTRAVPVPNRGAEQDRWESEGGARCRPTHSAQGWLPPSPARNTH